MLQHAAGRFILSLLNGQYHIQYVRRTQGSTGDAPNMGKNIGYKPGKYLFAIIRRQIARLSIGTSMLFMIRPDTDKPWKSEAPQGFLGLRGVMKFQFGGGRDRQTTPLTY
ncbi:MAG: hypothetical protein IJA79_02210 [Desulfovibrio sp.]|nr:hypothetical protein [Desulfovibrio sp.]